MSDVVLDSSAVIALLGAEPGYEIVRARLAGAVISTVNIAEIGDHSLRHGGSRDDLEDTLKELALHVVEPDMDLALDAASLLPATRSAGLSLADRFCLALARRLERSALTSDRAWGRIADKVGVQVELIR